MAATQQADGLTKIDPEFVRAIHAGEANCTPGMIRFRNFVLLALECGAVEKLRDKVCTTGGGPDMEALAEFDSFLNGETEITPAFARRMEAATKKAEGWMDRPHLELVPGERPTKPPKKSSEPPRRIVMGSNVKKVLRVMLADRDAWFSARMFHARIDITNGSLYPLLQRLETAAWLQRSSKDRCTYKLTPLGIDIALQYCEPLDTSATSEAKEETTYPTRL
jgi:hypothetical protein